MLQVFHADATLFHTGWFVLLYPALAGMSGLCLVAAELMKRRFYARA